MDFSETFGSVSDRKRDPARRRRPRKHGSDKPRLRLVSGQWYAFGKNTKAGKLLMVPAIAFCQRLNGAQAAGRGA